MAEGVFWAAVAIAAYVYFGYGIVVAALARLRTRKVAPDAVQPTVSVVVAANNEEQGIAARIENLLGADYPHDRLEVIVGSDGSTDGTVSAAKRFEPRVRVVG
jgi:cellulose synthase/poly-beta-1,6-N-acetylglucosamine synthase-like glycosyltransferase